MSISLGGKVAVVTGSGRGLGAAYALAMAAAGAAVVVNDVDAASAESTVASISAAGGHAVAEIQAVGDSGAAQALVGRAVSEFGRLDIMVTNAGVLRDRVLWKMSDEDFDLVIKTHLYGTWTCARAAAVQMREQGEGGRIIVIGSPARSVRQLRPDQLRHGEGRSDRLCEDGVDGAGARRDNRQCSCADRLDRDDADDPGV